MDTLFASSLSSPYQIIGEGGFGVVSRWQGPDGTVIAVKAATATPGAVDALQQEFFILSRMKASSHIPQVYGLFSSQAGRQVLAMEYIEGQNMADWLANNTPTLNDLENIAEQCIVLLSALQQARVLHHDIKPKNVMRTHTGTLILIDFGIAEVIPRFGRGYQPIGTSGYIAPEREVEDSYIGFQSDLYSVGSILNDLLCFIENIEQIDILARWNEVIDALRANDSQFRADLSCLQQVQQHLRHLRMKPPSSQLGWLIRWHIPWNWWRFQSFLRQSSREMTGEIISLLLSFWEWTGKEATR